MSAIRKRQSHWFESLLTRKTAVPLVFGSTRQRDNSGRADACRLSNNVAKPKPSGALRVRAYAACIPITCAGARTEYTSSKQSGSAVYSKVSMSLPPVCMQVLGS